MQVYNYIRVSGRDQIERDGPERQREAIAALCKAHGLLPMGEFFDGGISGTIEGLDRPAFRDMLDRIPHMERNGIHIEAVVVERADRLARDLLVSELLLAECRKRKIQVFAADRGLVDIATNEGDPTRVLIRQIMGALAQWEKSVLVYKLKLSRDRVKARTGRCEGAKPYGSFPGEPEIIRYLKTFWAEADPKPSFQSIADGLNAAGLRNRAGRMWTKGPVWGLIKARRADGTL